LANFMTAAGFVLILGYYNLLWNSYNMFIPKFF
jgi:hypothetical protein